MFSVRVPVLSEQMTSVQPKVSTAWSRRIRERCFTIRPTANAKEMVTMAGSPSGTAATARLTPVSSISKRGSPRRIPAPATMAQIIRQPMAIYLPSWSSFFCRGVCSSSISPIIPAILPIWVPMPVAMTRPTPRPAVRMVPI